MNIRSFSLLLFLALSTFVQAQIYDPVDWDMTCVDRGDGQYDLLFIATMDKGWNIYSQYLDGDDGPIPTSFNYEDSDHVHFIDKNEECDLHRKSGYDKLFDMEVVKYGKKAHFRQAIKTADASKPVSGYLEFMTCDDTKCLPPKTVDFSFDLSTAVPASQIGYDPKAYCADKVTFDGGTGSAPEDRPEDKMNEASQASKTTQSNGHSPAAMVKKKEQDATGAQVSVSKIQVAKEDESSSSSSISISLPANNTGKKSQIYDPVKWQTPTMRKLDDGKIEVTMKSAIQKDWHIYGPHEHGLDGPISTTYYLDTEGPVVHEQTLSSPYTVKEYDKMFDLDIEKLKKEATAVAIIDPKGASEIKGYLEYSACTHDRCLPPKPVDFTIDVDAMTIRAAGLETYGTNQVAPMAEEDVARLEGLYGINYSQLQSPIGDCVESVDKTNTLMGIFVLGFLGGLLALLTPCVFPMIPLTVSFFTKSSEKKGKGLGQAVFYGFSILAVYLLLSVPFHLLDTINPNILNDISTNVWLNLGFFAIFIFFALSFFGYFDLTLPASVTNKVSAAEGIGGVLGIFFMALTLALVSFSCTGPILGSLLAGSLSSEGGAMQLTAGFAGFGVALGLPFGLFAAFPSMMNKLPRSGGWLTTVKVVLGFIELALAFKFLSNADLVKQWGLLKIEPFLVIWILIAIATALYLLGYIRFPHDGPLKKRSAIRWGLAGLFAASAIYMLTGFRYNEQSGTYHSLSLLSGLAPPVCYSWAYDCKCPQGLDCFKDLKEGLAYAKSVGKPVLLDFTGHACVNCRKMEEHVWPEPVVYKYLDNDYVLVSLYVDEKIELPEDQKLKMPQQAGGTKRFRYTGDRWSYFQTEFFRNNSQPYYVLMTPEGQLLNNPVGYTPDKGEYADFLQCGLDNYRAVKRTGGVDE